VSALAALVLDELTAAQLAELAERLRPYLDRTEGVLLTPGEAAKRLGIHSKTLTRAAADGRVPGAVRVGRAWRFRADELALEPPADIRLPPPPLPRAKRVGTGAAGAIRAAGR
jgi:excisionase family DNA binding protein